MSLNAGRGELATLIINLIFSLLSSGQGLQKLPDIPQTLFGFTFRWNVCMASLVFESHYTIYSSDQKPNQKDDKIIWLRWTKDKAMMGRIRPAGHSLGGPGLNCQNKKINICNYIFFGWKFLKYFESIIIISLILTICSTGLYTTMLFNAQPNFIFVHRIVSEKMYLKHKKM